MPPPIPTVDTVGDEDITVTAASWGQPRHAEPNGRHGVKEEQRYHVKRGIGGNYHYLTDRLLKLSRTIIVK